MRRSKDRTEALTRQAAEARLVELYEANAGDLLAYAQRRIPVAEDAADLIAETFLVAWRRIAEVPQGGEARLWLFGVARRTLSDSRRGEVRRNRLTSRLRSELTSTALSSPPAESGSTVVLQGLAVLAEEDREVLLLAGWEELSPREIARVLGISTVASRSRLHRARRRLRAALETLEEEEMTTRKTTGLTCEQAK